MAKALENAEETNLSDWRADALSRVEAIALAAERVHVEAEVAVETISDLAKRLVETTEELKRDAEELRRILGEIPDGSVAPAADAGAVPGGLRLLVNQMLTEGQSREEIEARLRDDFGVADVEAAFGDGFEEEKPAKPTRRKRSRR
jgi:hypothetical protein